MPARVDDFLHYQHKGDEYNCLHFASDVWKAETGADLSDRLGKLLRASEGDRTITRSEVESFTKLKEPVSPCVVIMQRSGTPLHVGIYLRGRVLHLIEAGPEYMEVKVAARGFSRVRFYK